VISVIVACRPVATPRRAAGGHEPPHRVGAMLVHERDRLEDVAEVLAHLAPVLGEDVAEAEHVLVRFWSNASVATAINE